MRVEHIYEICFPCSARAHAVYLGGLFPKLNQVMIIWSCACWVMMHCITNCCHMSVHGKWQICLFFFCSRFHVPSCCAEPEAFTHAVSDARCVFDMGVSQQHVCSTSSCFMLLCVLDFVKDASAGLALKASLMYNCFVFDFNVGWTWICHEYSRRWWRFRWNRGSVRKGTVCFKITFTRKII